MTRLLRSCFVFIVAMVCFSAFAYAAVKNLPINHGPQYSVKLSATPGSSGVALAATVYTKSWDASASAPWNPVIDSALRYTFSAQRTWPCADAPSVATTASKTFNWMIAGNFTSFSVHVTALYSPPATIPRTLPRLPSVIGNGTASGQYNVKPTGSGLNTTWAVSPPAGSHGPAQVSITVTVPNPPEFTKFRFRITCGPGCQPSEGTSPLSLLNSYTLSTMISPGSPQLYAYIDQVHVGTPQAPDCTWVASWQVYKFDYYLVQ